MNATPSRQRRVLVVDDNRDSADSMALLLQASGHEVHVAHDAAGALEQARLNPPEIVLLDIGLPGTNGYVVAQSLRELPALKRAVLVAMTGYGQEEDRRRSREAGFDHHLVKPVDMASLERILENAAPNEGP